MKKLYPEEDVQAIADSIRAKNGSSDTYTIGQMSTAIDALPSGGPVVATENGANFYDYDGTLLYSYPKADVALMTELPPNPTHAGLTAQGWNWSLAKIQSWLSNYDGIVNVGQVYVTDDGATRIYVTLDEYTLEPQVGLGVNGTVEIDWGDETTHDTVTGTDLTTAIFTNHTYTQIGNYCIRIIPISGKFSFIGTTDNSAGSYLFIDSVIHNVGADGYRDKVKRIEIGTNIDTLATASFYNMRGLKYITVPTNITSLSTYVFYNCNQVLCLTIPYEVTAIGNYARAGMRNCLQIPSYRPINIGTQQFYNNFAMKGGAVTIPEIGASSRSIAATAFKECYGLTSIVIPDGYTSIGNYAFDGCSLTSAYISTSIKALGTGVFRTNYSLNKINIPSGTTVIGTVCFYYCRGLSHIDLPSNLKSIGATAFMNCYSLQNITIPAATTAIGAYGFAQDYRLRWIKFEGTTPPTAGSSAFLNLPTNCVIKVPSGTSATYAAANNYPDSSVYTYEEYTT